MSEQFNVIFCAVGKRVGKCRSGKGQSLSGKSKPFGALVDGEQELFAQLFVRFINGKVELVETSVGARKSARRTVIAVDLKLLHTVHA